MSSGAIIQVVSQGLQDIYLTGDPQMSFFHQVYKRHTNFALESVRQIFKGTPTANGVTRITLKRSGDLINGMYLIVDGSPNITPLANLVDRFELYVGGQKIDEYSGFSSSVLQQNAFVPKGYTGQIPAIDNLRFLPLHFFCCNDHNSPLPLCALQYHDVEVRIHWSVYVAGVPAPFPSLSFYVNYVHLDKTERNLYASKPYELLITQFQDITWRSFGTDLTKMIDLPFSNPIKVLFITSSSTPIDDYNILGPTIFPPTTTRVTLEFNGQERFTPQVPVFFQSVQPYYHGSPVGYINWVGNGGHLIYSFALNYGQTQPSGTFNFSRVDTARIHITDGNLLGTGIGIQNLRCLAIGYNVLKFENGLGGLVFAN